MNGSIHIIVVVLPEIELSEIGAIGADEREHVAAHEGAVVETEHGERVTGREHKSLNGLGRADFGPGQVELGYTIAQIGQQLNEVIINL